MRPGLTGVAQIYAPRDVARRHKFRYDQRLCNARELLARRPADSPLLLDHLPRPLGTSRQQSVGPFRPITGASTFGTHRFRFWHEIGLPPAVQVRAIPGIGLCGTLSPFMHDVIVVGGGPGGLYTATLLARSGFDVVVVEEHAAAGQPVHCTGVLAAEAFAEFGLSRASILNPLSTARFFSPSGLSISYTTPTTEALVVDRAVFDQNLFDMASAAGARVILDARVSTIDVGTHGVTVSTRAGRFDARACVLACGANYSLHRRLGLGMPAAYLRSAQLELKAERRGDVEVHFGNDVAPEGFAWIVPVERAQESYARVGLMCENDAAGFFRRFVKNNQEAWGLTVPLETATDIAPRQKMLPLAPIERTYADRVLAVGDAAGLVKSTTGGGIYYSLVSASIAAEVLGTSLRRDRLDALDALTRTRSSGNGGSARS